MTDISPMMRQYLEIKDKHKDSILFFRLGDFYEMFFDDAKLVSSELDLTLTGKDYGKEERAPMCGIPYNSCEAYIARLIKKGYKIAMCDQIEASSQSKGLVKREVVRVITPGTVIEDSMLDESRNNYICSINISEVEHSVGLAFCDISTGEIKVTEILGSFDEAEIGVKNDLGKFAPKEILLSGRVDFFEKIQDFVKEKIGCRCEMMRREVSADESKKMIFEHFGHEELTKLSQGGNHTVMKSVGNLFDYLGVTQKSGLERINKVEFYNRSEYMNLDINAIRNLEILETMRTKSKKGSLLWVLDKTKTAMGKRMLRNWVERPLLDVQKIKQRQTAVEELVNNTILREELADNLQGVYDLERLMTRITYGSAGARDVKSLANAISKFPAIKSNLCKAKSELLKFLCDDFNLLTDIFELIDKAIVDEPPILIREGGIIKEGYSKEVDSLRKDMNGGKTTVAEIEAKERQKTGIPKLKIGYNKVFGYYIELSNAHKSKAPDDYIRKQTLANCERYITQELKELEARIIYARDKINETEYEIFESVRTQISGELPKIIKSANIIAEVDTLVSLAEIASSGNYVKPRIDSEGEIIIKDGRHPVVEVLAEGSPFVPNDTHLDNGQNTVAIITGPNMAGKSTYMRQTALITLMAQIGSFVPASEAKIGIVDSIFTRIGASDDLASGQSTFMVEMNEVSDILKSATKQSLIILDEIGRGTSTFDGMSIAKSVLEYVANKNVLGAKTLFATHYHELTCMAEELENVKNYNIAVKKAGDNITFLRRIVSGAADESYGIEVAKLAGIPEPVISRAKEILNELESGAVSAVTAEKTYPEFEQIRIPLEQSSYNAANETIIEKLKSIDLNVMTPMEAINVLYELAKLVRT